MKRPDLYTALAIIITAIFILPVFAMDDVIVLPKTGHTKPPIHFSHRAHHDEYGALCTDCHHQGSVNKKCSSCHTGKDMGTVINLKDAFHQQCHDCHRRSAGPKACGRCHVTGRGK